MADFPEIFEKHAPKYDALVSREDYQQNLLPALTSITQFRGKRVVEFGAGTGRLTRLIAPIVDSIVAFDSSGPMLEVAEERLGTLGRNNWKLEVADHRKVPTGDETADIVISGWSICFLAVDGGDRWERELDAGLLEMRRVSVAEGKIILIETLGTGYSSPHPPDDLKAYYNRLEDKGFLSTWIRTDYRFRSMSEAKDLATFFFGVEPVAAIQGSRSGVILPECTGIWWIEAEKLR